MNSPLDGLRDPLAIGLAQATALLTYIFGAELWQAIAAGTAVMIVRVVAGVIRPPKVPGRIADPDVLTKTLQEIAKLIGWRNTDEQIAAQRKLAVARVEDLVDQILKRTGYRSRDELADWARAVWPPPHAVDKILPDNRWIRMVLMFGGFLSLGLSTYTLFVLVLRAPLCQRFGLCV